MAKEDAMKKDDPTRDKIEREDKAKKERSLIGEKRAGVAEGFIDQCDGVVDYFQMDHFEASCGDLLLTDFFHEPTHLQEECDFDRTAKANGRETIYESDYENMDCFDSEWWEDIRQEAVYTPPQVAFATGFVLGQMIEVTDPNMQDNIEAIKKVIREKQLLPYLPRGKKGGRHEEETHRPTEAN
jgi:hypothetical protein